MNIIEILNNSNITALKRKAADISKWSKCKHNKVGLETYLQFHIVELHFNYKDGSEGTIYCTSNLAFIAAYSKLKNTKDNKKIQFKYINGGIKTADPNTIDTWDLIDNQRKSINLFNNGQDKWYIKDFVPLEPEDCIEILTVIRQTLKA